MKTFKGADMTTSVKRENVFPHGPLTEYMTYDWQPLRTTRSNRGPSAHCVWKLQHK